MKTISLATNNRPHYLQQCLDALKACPGVEDWLLVVSQEPNLDCFEMISKINWMPVNFFRNTICRGCNVNTFLAIETAFRLGSVYNLYLEDDIVLSPDALTLATQWGLENREPMALRRRVQDLNAPTEVRLSDEEGLLGCGFVCAYIHWPYLREHWFEMNPKEYNGETWDLALGDALLKSGTKLWRPMINRSRHIGVVGTHTRAETYDNEPLSGPNYQGCENQFLFVS